LPLTVTVPFMSRRSGLQMQPQLLHTESIKG
jgi:hypothetical protein